MGQNIKQANAITIEALLNQLASSNAGGCLQVSCDQYSSVSFFLYFWEGKLCYATNSLAPFERLERQLRRLSNQIPQLTNKVIKEVRHKVPNDIDLYSENPSDYQGLLWLASKQSFLQDAFLNTLLRRLIREVFELLFSLPQPIIYRFIEQPQPLVLLNYFDVNSFIDQCQKRLQAWQVFSTYIKSSYGRLYLVAEMTQTISNLTENQNNTLCQLLKGLNFRQISAIIDKDELIVARLLYPEIINGNVIVRDPKRPFDKLPNFPTQNEFDSVNVFAEEPENWLPFNEISNQNASGKDTMQVVDKQWKIACIDDSHSIQNEVSEILENNIFLVSKITQPMNALAELLDFMPDIILLDIDMPYINGYELCSLLRNQNEFKSTPIVMMTGERGLVNLTKSKLVGATDYVSKPLDQTNMFNVIFKYLN